MLKWKKLGFFLDLSSLHAWIRSYYSQSVILLLLLLLLLLLFCDDEQHDDVWSSPHWDQPRGDPPLLSFAPRRRARATL